MSKETNETNTKSNGSLISNQAPSTSNSTSADCTSFIKFFELRSHYDHEESIFVVYELKKNYEPASRDWIALYKSSTEDETQPDINKYHYYSWAPFYPRDKKFPCIRSINFPPGHELSITPEAGTHYEFMYISYANEILARSNRFCITDFIPLVDLDTAYMSKIRDGFTLVKSKRDIEEGNFEVIKNQSDKSETPSVKSDDLDINEIMEQVQKQPSSNEAGKNLIQIFDVRYSPDEKAVVPYRGSQQQQACPCLKCKSLQINLQSIKRELKECTVDAEAVKVELEYVDKELTLKSYLVDEMTHKVKDLLRDNRTLTAANENLHNRFVVVRDEKHDLENKVNENKCKIEQLQVVAHLYQRGNDTLQQEIEKVQQQILTKQNDLKLLRSDFNEAKQVNVTLEQKLSAVKQEIKSNETKQQGINGKKIAKLEKGLRDECIKSEGLQHEVDGFKHKAKLQDIEIQKYQSEIERLQQDLQESKQKEDALEKSMLEKINHAREKVKKCETEVIDLKKKAIMEKRRRLEIQRQLGTIRHDSEEALAHKGLKNRHSNETPSGVVRSTKTLKTASSTQQSQTSRKQAIQQQSVLSKQAQKFSNRLETQNKSSASAFRKASNESEKLNNTNSQEDIDLPFNWDSVESFFKSFTPTFNKWCSNDDDNKSTEIKGRAITKQSKKTSFEDIVTTLPSIKASNKSSLLSANQSGSSVKGPMSTPSNGSIRSPESQNQSRTPKKLLADYITFPLPAQTASLQSQRPHSPVPNDVANSHDVFPFTVYPLLNDEQSESNIKISPPAQSMDREVERQSDSDTDNVLAIDGTPEKAFIPIQTERRKTLKGKKTAAHLNSKTQKEIKEERKQIKMRSRHIIGTKTSKKFTSQGRGYQPRKNLHQPRNTDARSHRAAN